MPSVFGGKGASLVRLPLIRTVVQGNKVLLRIVGSALAPVGSADNLFLGPNGYVSDPEQAQDFVAKISEETTIIENPGAPGKSAYELWLMEGNEGTQEEYLNSLKGKPGQNATDAQIAAKVNEWLTSYPPAKGENATPQQIDEAVQAYMATKPPLKGDQGPSSKVSLGTISLSQNAVLAIVAGDRDLTFTVNGILAGDDVFLFPVNHLPSGYFIKSVVATENNRLSVRLNAPLLAIGASYNITCRVVVLR